VQFAGDSIGATRRLGRLPDGGLTANELLAQADEDMMNRES